MLRVKLAEFFICTPLLTFWSTLVANKVNKNLSNKFVVDKKAVFEAVAPVPLP